MLTVWAWCFTRAVQKSVTMSTDASKNAPSAKRAGTEADRQVCAQPAALHSPAFGERREFRHAKNCARAQLY